MIPSFIKNLFQQRPNSPHSPQAAYGVERYNGPGSGVWDGEKFPGGFGATELLTADYWTLRARSSELFGKNLYAKGLINRLITNEINTGLTPEASPDEDILGVEPDALNDWTDDVEARHAIWARNPSLCDYKLESTFGAIQRQARLEALVSGDVLVVIRQSPITSLPLVQLIDGMSVQSPLEKQKNDVREGVELDSDGRTVAYWVRQEDRKFIRIPVWGKDTGRRISFMIYGSERRVGAVRGEPLLSTVLQSLKEIDRYRDSVQRKAVINSILAMFIKKGDAKMGSLPVQGGAVKKGTATVNDGSGPGRRVNLASQIPGVIFEELQHGEEPILKGGEGTDINFGTFEEAIIQAVAWANEIPPEILRLAFSNNYSASQAAINEFKIYLNKIWATWGDTFCTPIYIEWLLAETLLGKISTPGLLESWRDPKKYDTFGALTSVEWYGSIKPSTDTLKQAKGSQLLVGEGWSTNAREARITTGTKFKNNIKRLKHENELKVEALRPLAEFKQLFSAGSVSDATDTSAKIDRAIELLEQSQEV